MPKFVQIRDSLAKKLLTRSTADAREIVGQDPARYSFVDPKSKLRPIVHEPRTTEEGEPDPVAAAPISATKPPPPAPAKKQPSQATQDKRVAALAKARAARKANLAKAADQSPAA